MFREFFFLPDEHSVNGRIFFYICGFDFCDGAHYNASNGREECGMNDEFFEMNRLDATHSIDTALDQFSQAGSSDRETDDSQDVRIESKEKKSGKGES